MEIQNVRSLLAPYGNFTVEVIDHSLKGSPRRFLSADRHRRTGEPKDARLYDTRERKVLIEIIDFTQVDQAKTRLSKIEMVEPGLLKYNR